MTKNVNKSIKILLFSLLCITFAAVALIKSDVFAQKSVTKYLKNNDGQTYGSIRDAGLDSEPPELIAAIGIDGTSGYVYYKDFVGEEPSTPEEAKEYMDRVTVLFKEAKKRGDNYAWYIPLYEADGTTQIGLYGVSMPEEYYYSDNVSD